MLGNAFCVVRSNQIIFSTFQSRGLVGLKDWFAKFRHAKRTNRTYGGFRSYDEYIKAITDHQPAAKSAKEPNQESSPAKNDRCAPQAALSALELFDRAIAHHAPKRSAVVKQITSPMAAASVERRAGLERRIQERRSLGRVRSGPERRMLADRRRAVNRRVARQARP